ncbi:MAG: glycosyl hydrolase 53 family protein [Planctomycetota bacterium]
MTRTRHNKLTYGIFSLLLAGLIITAEDGVCAEFMRGADISIQTRQEADGVVYNEYGVPKDVLTIFKNHDLNWIRIRIFNNPSGSLYGVCQDLAYVTTLGTRVKAEGFKFLLDFHYSDTWADPGKQYTPAAWASYNHSQLVTAVHDYTRDVISHLRTNNAMPDMVQIGNEVINGMLWPDGQISSGSWANFVDLINAGITGVNDGRGTEPMPKIMIHIDRGGDWAGTQWFFDNLIAYGVQFDVIGQSFYPEWHGTLDDLAYCLNNTAARYPHDIVVAEAGDYYTGSGKTPESQKAYLEGVIQRVQDTPGGKGIGVFYWEPTWVWEAGGVSGRALFEPISGDWSNVNMLMAMEAFDISGDTTPPAAPTGLSATAGVGAILLDWNDNTEGDIAGYNIWRMPSGGYYEQINGSLVTVSNYTDTDVSIGTTYYYIVRAVDTAFNESDVSNEVSASSAGAPGTGAILCEWWTGITGTVVSDLTSDVNYPDNPSGKELLITLEGPINWDDYYGTRIRGYLNPVATGSYTFWIASDNDSELWLSTDDNPANVSLIAYVSGYTPSRYWTKYAEQQSSPISLTAGQKYYIEVLHKDGDGGDNVAVAWQGPGIAQQIIDGLYLSPCCLDFENFADFAAQWEQSGCNTGNDWCYGFDFNRDGIVSLDDLQAFADAWLAGM